MGNALKTITGEIRHVLHTFQDDNRYLPFKGTMIILIYLLGCYIGE